MQIDRSTFLSLVGTIGAVVACGGAQHDEKAVIVAMDPIDAGAPVVTAPPIIAPVEKPPEPEPVVADGPEKPTGIWAGDYDPKAKAHTCSDLKCPGPTQEAMGALRNACRTISGRLTTEGYQRFMSCMMKQNNTRNTCDLMLVGEKSGECLEGWYTTSKITAESEAKCKPIVAACAKKNRDPNASGTLKMNQCQQMMSVTNPAAEKKMIHCITEYCEGALGLCHGGYG